MPFNLHTCFLRLGDDLGLRPFPDLRKSAQVYLIVSIVTEVSFLVLEDAAIVDGVSASVRRI